MFENERFKHFSGLGRETLYIQVYLKIKKIRIAFYKLEFTGLADLITSSCFLPTTIHKQQKNNTLSFKIIDFIFIF